MDETGTEPTEQWFQAFVDILDYMETKGDQIQLVTYSQLVDLFPENTAPEPPPPAPSPAPEPSPEPPGG